MSIKISLIAQEFAQLVELERGGGEAFVTHIRAPENADSKSLIFVNTLDHLRAALQTPATAWVVNQKLLGEVPAQITTVLTTKNVQLAMAKIAKKFFAETKHHKPVNGPDVHPTAIIASSAKLGAGCRIGPGAVLGENCEIGENSIVGANSVLEPDVKVGQRTHIHPLVFIGHDCEVGSDCDIKPHTTIGGEGYGFAQDETFTHHRITHYGRVIIEDRVHIGASVQLDRGTFLDSRIGSGTKIDNHCHLGHNFVVGKNTLITAGMISGGSATIGSYCVFGGRVTIRGHLNIPDRTQIAGISGVGNTVKKTGEYGGFPLQEINAELRTRATMKSLPRMRKQMQQILRHLGLGDEPTDGKA